MYVFLNIQKFSTNRTKSNLSLQKLHSVPYALTIKKDTGELHANVSGDVDMKAYIYGRVNEFGSIVTSASSSGFSVNRTSTGVYNISFDNPIDVNSYNVVVTAINSAVVTITTTFYNPPILVTFVPGTDYFTVICWDVAGTASSKTNTDFSFVVYTK